MDEQKAAENDAKDAEQVNDDTGQEEMPEDLEDKKQKVQLKAANAPESTRKKKRRRDSIFDFPPEDTWRIGHRIHSSTFTRYHDATTAYDLYSSGRSQSFRERALGARAESSGMFVFLTYKDLFGRAHRFASALLKLNSATAADTNGLMPVASKVALFSASCVEWIITDLACCMMNLAVVTVCEHFGVNELKAVLEQTKVEYLVVDTNKRAEMVLKAAKSDGSSLRNVVLFDAIETATKQLAESAHVSVHNFRHLWDDPDRELLRPRVPDATHRYALNYSSSKRTENGQPVAVDFAHSNVVSAVHSFLCLPGVNLTAGDSYLSYLPLWVFQERCTVLAFLAAGGHVSFHRAEASKLLNDAAFLKPTVFSMLPRLARSLYAEGLHYSDGLDKKPSNLFSCAYHERYKRLLQPGEKIAQVSRALMSLLWNEKTAFQPFSVQLGGCVRLVITPARCPFSPILLSIMQCFLGDNVKIMTVYGSSECASSAAAGYVSTEFMLKPTKYVGFAGMPVAFGSMKLVNAQVHTVELKASDNHGELCVRSKSLPLGKYYRDDQPYIKPLNEKSFVHERTDSENFWFHSGDAAAWTADNQLRILGSLDSAFTANGKPVFPDSLEAVFSAVKYCVQAFVFDLGGAVGALCVIDSAHAVTWARKQGMEAEQQKKSALIVNCELVKTVKAELAGLCLELALGDHSKPTLVELLKDEFTVANGQLFPTHRINRCEVARVYNQNILRMRQAYKSVKIDPVRVDVQDEK